jgi:hypothetical protein
MGKCPSCKHAITMVHVEPITLEGPQKNSWKGASYVCPSCAVVLSVGFDPIALKNDLLTAIGGPLSSISSKLEGLLQQGSK